jgi:SAM-dependent methyltransferase
VPVFTEAGRDVEIRSLDHVSHQPSPEILAFFGDAASPWLHLGAGASIQRYPNSIELETAVFCHTDVVGDASSLPFQDGSLGGVLALNVFEHLADPERAASELHRVLRPGSPVLIQTAFLQPLHADPFHFYNATEKGIERWFADFSIHSVEIPHNFHPIYALSWFSSELLYYLSNETDREEMENATIGELAEFWRNAGSRSGPIWNAMLRLPAVGQRVLAAGFELRAHRP